MKKSWTLNKPCYCAECWLDLIEMGSIFWNEYRLSCQHYTDGTIRVSRIENGNLHVLAKLELLGYIITNESQNNKNEIQIKPQGQKVVLNYHFYCVNSQHTKNLFINP